MKTQLMKQGIILLMVFLISPGFAQSNLPLVTVRFANPTYDCPTKTYCLDVEFNSDTPDEQVFGVNVRFFYDDNILEYLSVGDFANGYSLSGVPEIITGVAGSGAPFGLAGKLEMFNGVVQLTNPPGVPVSTTGWTKLFSICFHVDDPGMVGFQVFCPAVIWDLQEYPDPLSGGGFLPGDDGVVITLVNIQGQQESKPTFEDVVQYNWEYNSGPGVYGNPVSVTCLEVKCGTLIPVSNWAVILGIGLMVIATALYYRRRAA